MIYPIIREDKKTKLLIEYIPEPKYIIGLDIETKGYSFATSSANSKFHKHEQLELKPLIRKQLSSPTKEKFEPNHITRYFILDDKTYVDVRVLSNINGDLELFCMGYKEVYGEPRQFWKEKVVMTLAYYNEYIESVLKRFALKAIQL